MAKIFNTEYERAKNILLSDKINTPSRLKDAIRCDVIGVLKSYMDIETFDMEIDPTDEGYILKAEGRAIRLK